MLTLAADSSFLYTNMTGCAHAGAETATSASQTDFTLYPTSDLDLFFCLCHIHITSYKMLAYNATVSGLHLV